MATGFCRRATEFLDPVARRATGLFGVRPLKLQEPVAQMTKMSEKKDAISEIVTPWTETTIQLTLTSGRGNSEMNWPFLAFLC